MELSALGFDDWLEQQSAPLLQSGHSLARVTAVDRGAFLVRNQDTEVHAELAGKFRFAVEVAVDLPCVGDWVCVQGHGSDGPAIIHGVVPRRTWRSEGPTPDDEPVFVARPRNGSADGDAERAREILKNRIPSVASGPFACPSCGSDSIRYEKVSRRSPF
jgi:hypothetical protein